jgi:hypothetical protein
MVASDHRYRWVWSEGGPLIVIPEAGLNDWSGAPFNYPQDEGDYGRACAVDGDIGVIPVGDPPVQALVLGDQPSNTTYLPERRTFLRWFAADSERAILTGLDAALAEAEWEDGPAWDVPGPAVLFDSAHEGRDIDSRNCLRIDLEADRYATRSAYVEIDDVASVIAIELNAGRIAERAPRA